MQRFFLHIVLILSAVSVMAQQIAIDRGIKVGGLWCFPLVQDSLRYFYLPSTANLAINEQGLPKFSMLRYVINKPTEGEQSITDADGGAVLHFLVLYNTPQEAIKKAENILKNKVHEKATIQGTVIFKKARYALVSSILNDKQYEVLSTGDAPVLENSTMAFSFELTPKDAKILLESFKTGTSDVSIVFDFVFEGFTESYQAQLEVNWTKTYQMRDRQAGASLNVEGFQLGGEVKDQVEKLLNNQAIKLNVVGSNSRLESLMDRVYTKIIDLLYEPVPPEKVGAQKQSGLSKSISEAFSKGLSENPIFSFNMAYKSRNIRNEGEVKYDFSGRSNIERHHFVTFNIGNLHKKYGTNPLIFKDISLYDIAFQKRQITVGLDGEVERDFDKIFNNATVLVKKTHQDSSMTLQEITLNKATWQKQNRTVSYLNQGDQDRLQWLEYEYQVKWQLIGGGSIASEWLSSNSPIINLHVPYKRWKVSLEGDLAKLKDQGVSLVAVQVNYTLGGQQRTERIRISPQDNLETKTFEVTLPLTANSLDYSIVWVKKDGKQHQMTGKDKYGLIVIDNIPNP